MSRNMVTLELSVHASSFVGLRRVALGELLDTGDDAQSVSWFLGSGTDTGPASVAHLCEVRVGSVLSTPYSASSSF